MQLKNLALALLALILAITPLNDSFEDSSQETAYEDFTLIDANDDFELRLNSNNIQIIKDKEGNVFIKYWVSWCPTVIGKAKMAVMADDLDLDINKLNKITSMNIGTILNLNTMKEIRFSNILKDVDNNILDRSDKNVDHHAHLLGFKNWRNLETLKYVYGQLASGAYIDEKGILKNIS